MQDVVDNIIDCLQDCPEALANCAAVCRDWTPRPHHNLFADITLPYSDRVEDTMHRRRQYDELVRVNPRIALYTKNLCLLGPRGSHGDLLVLIATNPRGSWDDQYFAQLSHLVNVRSLKITLFTYDSLIDLARACLAAFPSLEYLTVEKLEIPNRGPEPVWIAPTEPPAVRAASNRPHALKGLAVIDLHCRPGTKQVHSFALAKELGGMGELSALTSLELLDGPALTQSWVPLLPAISASLMHYAFSLNDVFGHGFGFYEGLGEHQLRRS